MFAVKNLWYNESELDYSRPRKPKSPRNTQFILVESQKTLEKVIKMLAEDLEIAVDIETTIYRNPRKTCLIQISTRTMDIVIDAWKLSHCMHFLNKIFRNRDISKVIHGCPGDIHQLQKDFSLYFVNVFDTKVAAEMLQLEETNLKYVLDYYCGIQLNKRYQKSDWSRRPLSTEQLYYAQMDTHYLLYLHDIMRNELIDDGLYLGALLKAKTYCLNAYSKQRIFLDEIQTIKQRFPKFRQWKQHKVFEDLMFWRDVQARGQGKDPDMILGISDIYNIANILPETNDEVYDCCHMSRQPGRSKLNQICEVLNEIY